MTTREHEHTLNVWLAEALKKRGLNAVAERPDRRRRIDVKVTLQRARAAAEVVVAVEAEQGQNQAKMAEAIRDAEARLPAQQNLARCAIALCYPDLTTPESLPSADLMWTVRDGQQDAGPASWQTGNVDALATAIRLAPAQLGDPDGAAATLSSSLDSAVAYLSESQKRLLAQALDLPRQTKNGKSVRNPWDAPAKRALLVVATAVMFHSRLDSHLSDSRPEYDSRTGELFAGNWPPIGAQICVANADPVGSFLTAWNLILALDYKPIFETAHAALLSVPADPSFSDAIGITAGAALAAARDTASYRHDLLGRIFHTVLDTARYDGSFYTTTPAARLLATLAIGEDMCDWTDLDAIANLRITDPSCGTGTLLMAAAERIRELSPALGDGDELSQTLIEKVLTGYDVNLTATHMAATTLGLLSPSTHFRNMKIWRTLLGIDDGDAYIGSLEFLDRQPKILGWPNVAEIASHLDSGAGVTQGEAAEPADLVIMNPPFTRSDLRHNQFDNADERQIQAREKQIFSNQPVHLSSNGNAFLILADYIIKTDNSAIAAVLPLVTATNASALEIRRHLASRYHIETIVTSHDPERVYFSESTTIGEILLICRRWLTNQGEKPPTQVINLAHNPATPHDAMAVAVAIKNGTVYTQEYGTVQHWPAREIAAGNWGAVQFLAENLCEKFVSLKRNELFATLSLGNLAEIGPSGSASRISFNRNQLPSPGGMVALWDHKTDVTQAMAAITDGFVVPKAGKEREAQQVWGKRGRLMLPERVRLNTVRAVCVRLETPAVGSAWVVCRPFARRVAGGRFEKAICAYLNSSVGILAMLGGRSNTTPSYPRFSLDDLRNLPVPDFAALGANAVAQLTAAYDAHANDILLPLPQMDADPVRRALDAAVTAALGLDGEMVATIRRQLAAEPSVTGRRYGE